MATWQPGYSDEPSAAEHFGFNDTQIVAVRSAFQAWENVANLNFDEVSESNLNVGDFRFAFSSALPSSAWGWSGYPNDYWASAADVWVNSTYGRDTDWSAGTYNYEALLHEIGHGLGLKHPGNYGGSSAPYLPSSLDVRNYTIMSYNDPINEWYWDGGKNVSVFVARGAPMVYDIQAIQYLYGTNTGGGDIYNFDPHTPFYKTIWDAGGIDTIDISNYSLDSIISLITGSYSKVSFYSQPTGYTRAWYDGSDSLGIAFGAIIENANGGSGSDILTGGFNYEVQLL
ncbi:M10 family metallopeptidase [Nitrosomonas sp.]|uniref:M10 family metallopeptidase n=1 Tax=Nitrosomonas sp. TaxID=42353 RepID=UPI0032ED83D2